jgi:hypothetical protein
MMPCPSETRSRRGLTATQGVAIPGRPLKQPTHENREAECRVARGARGPWSTAHTSSGRPCCKNAIKRMRGLLRGGAALQVRATAALRLDLPADLIVKMIVEVGPDTKHPKQREAIKELVERHRLFSST